MRYLLRRVLLTLLSLVLFSLLSFLLVHSMPGGPFQFQVDLRGSRELMPDVMNELNRFYGFDRPLIERYLNWVHSVGTFDFGQSLYSHEPVSAVLARALPVSLLLNAASMFCLYFLSLPIAIILAVFKNSFWVKGMRVALLALHSIPSFVLGLLLLWLFAVQIDWFPLQAGAESGFKGYVLPGLTLVLAGISPTVFYLRSAVVEELRRPYVIALHARGISRPRILFVHVLRNVGVSYISQIEECLAYFFAGTLLVETVFGVSGVGRLAYDSFLRRDYPVMLALLLLFGVTGILANAIGDLLYRVADPRVRLK